MGELKDYVLLGFGWLLGILSPAVVERVRRAYRRDEIARGLAIELHDLRFRLVLAVLHLRRRSARLTIEEVRHLRPLLEAVRDQEDRAHFVVPTLTLLDSGEAEYVKTANASYDRSKSPLAPEERAPFLTHMLGEVTLLPISQQAIVLRIDSALRLYNNQVELVRQGHDRTFDSSLSPDNHRTVVENLDAAADTLGDRARILVDQISRLVSADGSVLRPAR